MIGAKPKRYRPWIPQCAVRPDGKTEQVPLLCRIDTADEVEYYRNGGILHYVLRNLMKSA